MVSIVNPIPKPEMLKYTDCRNCGIGLSYVLNDVEHELHYDYGGDCDVYYYIVCPGCNKKTSAKNY